MTILRALRLLPIASFLAIGPAHAVSARAPDGLYLMTRFAFGSFQIEVWFFGKGQFAKEPLTVGKTFDFAAAEREKPGSTGTVSLAGDRMTLSGPAFKGADAKLEPKNDGCFYWNAGLFCPATRFPAGAKLSGTFSGSLGSGGASSALSARFTADGQYEFSRSGQVQNASAYAGSWSSSKGRYDLDGNVITLTPASGGPAILMTTLPYDDGSKGPQPRRLYLGGFMLKQN